MHMDKSFTMPVPAEAERKRNELFMDDKRFVKFAKALRLQCDQGFLETYERKKVLFPHARIVWPRRLEERLHRHKLSHDTRSLSTLTRSKEHRPFIEFSEMQQKIDSGEGFVSPSRTDIIDFITKKGHPISCSLCGELVPGVVQHPQQRPFRSWKTWCFDSPEGYRHNRAEHYYGWWQILELYELERINLEIETPHWRLQPTAEQKRFLKGMTWKILHRDINPPTRVDFDPYHEPLEEIWPTAWSRWSLWIERAADFDWRSNASLQRYDWQVRQGNNGEKEWDLHLQREKDAAKLLTEGTRNDEWTRLLRALCRFEEHLAREERLLLRVAVHNIIHIIVDLLSVAFNKDMRQLSLDHDGPASLMGENISPGHLLKVLDDRLFITDTLVREFFEFHFRELQSRLDAKLESDCASSFMNTLSTVYNEPITLALAFYEHANSQEQGGSWKNQQLWAATRALIVAGESETRSWFGQDSLYNVFCKLYPADWASRWTKFQKQYPIAAKNKLDSTQKFVNTLEEFMAEVDRNIASPIQRLDWHATIAYFARNWNAHNGENPPPYAARLSSLIVTSVVRILLISWDAARSNQEYNQNIAKKYPVIIEQF